MRTIMMALAALAVASGTQARLPPPAVRATVATFQRVDTNQNRQISASEWQDAGRNPDNFAAIDRNNNGQIGPLELLRAFFLRFAQGRN